MGTVLLREARTLAYGCYLLAVLAVLAALGFGLTHHTNRADVCLLLGLVAALVGFGLLLRGRLLNGQLSASLLLCYAPFALLWLLALASPLTSWHNILFGDWGLLIWLGLLAFVGPALVLAVRLGRQLRLAPVLAGLRQYWAIAVLLAAFVLLSLETLTMWVNVDSLSYLNATQTALAFNFSLEFPDLLRLCGHHSYVAILWYMIGGYLTPNSAAGLRLVNLVLVASSVLCVYQMLLHFCRGIEKADTDRWLSLPTRCALLTALYAFNPLVLGPLYLLNLDVLTMVFAAWTALAFLKRNNVLLTASSLALVFSKEVGLVMLLGLLLFSLAAKLLARRKPASAQSWRAEIIMALVLAAAAVINLCAPSWAEIATPAPGFNIFTLNALNIVEKLKQLYLLDFSWLLTLVILAGGGAWLWQRRKRAKRDDRDSDSLCQGKLGSDGLALLGMYLAVVVFNLTFLTWSHPRYIQPHLPLFCVAASLALAWLGSAQFTPKAAITTGALFIAPIRATLPAAVLAVLLLAQTFITFDPVTLAAFRQVSIGQTELVTTAKFLYLNEQLDTDPDQASHLELVDAVAYNRQAGYQGGALEAFLKDIDYNSTTLVLVDPIYDYEGNTNLTYIALLGGRNSEQDTYYYDPQSGQISYLPNGEPFNVEVVYPKSVIEISNYPQYQRIYYLSAPWRNSFQQWQPVANLPILEAGTSTYRGWELEYRRLK
ncbi:MAG: hypothetical protein LBR39_08030 [Coriobacteriales bacterium]|jgi:hypothetical protein|nr:hypothetical protein [Coriobacteriales bacterium]